MILCPLIRVAIYGSDVNDQSNACIVPHNEKLQLSTLMELIIIVSTITSFFSHYMIERPVVANSVSVVVATLVTWMLVGDMTADLDVALLRTVLYTLAVAFAISIVVGRLFAYHKKCS
jgi:hypothetical protein